jgi:hypothetical protein
MSKRTEEENSLIAQFLPPVGTNICIGELAYRVVHLNPGKRRFSAVLLGRMLPQPKPESRLVDLDGKPLK